MLLKIFVIGFLEHIITRTMILWSFFFFQHFLYIVKAHESG